MYSVVGGSTVDVPSVKGDSKVFMKIDMHKSEGNIGEAVEQKEKLCDEVETVREFTYLGDWVSAGGGCGAAVIARVIGGLSLRSAVSCCMAGDFYLRLKGAVYGSYVWTVILYGSESLCLKEGEIGILRSREGSMVIAMCCVQLCEQKISTDLMFLLGLNVAMDQLAMANSVHWYCHVLRREDGHVLRRALDFEVDGQKKKWRLSKKV